MTTGKVAAIAKSMLGSGVSSAVADYLDEHPDIFTDYAKVDGSYSSLTAGNAEQLVSTVGVEDKTPYLFRTTGGSADVGDRVKLSEIPGGTVAWNQLAENGNFASTTGWFPQMGSISAANNELTYTVSTIGVHYYDNRVETSAYPFAYNIPKDHVVLLSCETYAPYSNGFYMSARTNQIGQGGVGISNVTLTPNVWNKVSKIAKLNNTLTDIAFYWSMNTTYQVGDSVKLRNVIVIDLTAMFGSTIADYLYGLESGTAGAGVAKLKSWGFCTKPYYAYDAGSLLSVNTSAHKTVGFNQWDEQWEAYGSSQIKSKHRFPVIAGATYYCKCPSVGVSGYYFKDLTSSSVGSLACSNITFTIPNDVHYMMIYTSVGYGTTYNNDICINLSWDGERDGEYEPYEEHSYALDDVELRGIPKLDANNNLYYDGDSYAPDGTVTRKYATRAYTEGDATDGSTMITDGTNTVYKLDTPTTESADPYQETQICNDFGTEEFVDSRTVPMPVGANALYQANLRAKLEMAPDSPSGNGDYIVRQTDGLNEYVLLEKELPSTPAEDGTYSLKCTVADGTATLSWVSDS